MNLYAFSLQNPLRYVDPDGRQPEAEHLALREASIYHNLQGDPQIGAKVLNAVDEVVTTAVNGIQLSGAYLAPCSCRGDLIESAKANARDRDAALAERQATRLERAAQSSGSGRGRRQERLRQIGADPKTPRSDRGWIKQEQNNIKRGKQKSIRNPPGKELSHTRGREAAKGYDHVESPSHLKPKEHHVDQHKIDDYGRKNPQQGPPPQKRE